MSYDNRSDDNRSDDNRSDDRSREADIQDLVQAIQSRVVPHVANRVNGLDPAERSRILTPALERLSISDPASAQWFVRHLLAPESREQLKQGILTAAMDYLRDSGFVDGQDFELKEGILWLSRAALPFAAADDDPFGQLLVAEFCQLQD